MIWAVWMERRVGRVRHHCCHHSASTSQPTNNLLPAHTCKEMERANAVVAKSEFPFSICWLVASLPLRKTMTTTQTLRHAFAVKKKRIVRQAHSHHSALLRLSLSNAPGLRQFGRLKNGLLQYKSQTYNFFFSSGFISWYL